MSRTYVVGLPVVVEVGDDGVTLTVDTSELPAAIWDSPADYDYDEEQMIADDEAISAALERDRASVGLGGPT